jgi:predicted alpha-1,2-mannosidase
METFIEVADSNTYALRGYRYSRGWADDQKVYFYAEFSKAPDSLDIIQEDVRIWENVTVNIPTFVKAGFQTAEGEQVMLKVALSPVSMEGAYKNMQAELQGWDFETITAEADRLWNKELGKIKINTADKDALKIFYTALYHSMIAPSEFCDVDGAYRGADGKTHENPGFKTHTTSSLWDTYRAAMPLYSIFQTERYADFINTMLAIYKEQGKLPVWHLHGCETNCMVGNPGIPPVADAIVKGLKGFDHKLALEAMKESALRPDRGQEHRMKYGYIPCDLFNEAVAYDLEYALADGALALAAEKLGDDEAAE